MRLGRWVIMRMHPDEKTLRTVEQLTPALRALVARIARSEAKDAVQTIMEGQNIVFRNEAHDLLDAAVGATFDLTADKYGSDSMKLTDEQRNRAQSHVDCAYNTLWREDLV